MNGVNISPNLKHKRIFIDSNGNEVKPFTNQIIKPVEKPYVPTQAEMAVLAAKKGGEEKLSKEELLAPAVEKKPVGRPKKKEEQTEKTGGLESVINKAIEKKLEGAIAKALESVDLEGILNKAIDKLIK